MDLTGKPTQTVPDRPPESVPYPTSPDLVTVCYHKLSVADMQIFPPRLAGLVLTGFKGSPNQSV